MIPTTFLYDENIDRPKLTEQKKPIWVYSFSHHKWGRNKDNLNQFILSWLKNRGTVSSGVNVMLNAAIGLCANNVFINKFVPDLNYASILEIKWWVIKLFYQ